VQCNSKVLIMLQLSLLRSRVILKQFFSSAALFIDRGFISGLFQH
jgi:hypothetical protein